MSGGGVLGLGVFLAALVLTIGALIWDEARHDIDPPVLARPSSAPATVTFFDPALLVLSHAAPDRRYTTGEAHMQTQLHRECLVDECPRKSAALAVLVDAGLVKMDSHR